MRFGRRIPRVLRRLMIGVLHIALVTYIAVALFALLRSESMIFQPRPSSYADSPEIVPLISADGDRISAIHLVTEGSPWTVLFSHGNAEDLGDVLPFLRHLQERGYSVVGYDYPGYGTSTGTPTERGANQAIDAVYTYLVEECGTDPSSIVVWGRSVGSGPSVHLAAAHPVGAMILESAFVSTFRVMVRVPVLPFDRFDNLARIDEVQCPVLFVHGQKDRIIPLWHGQALFERAKEPKEKCWIPDAGHNDLQHAGHTIYWRAIRRFLEEHSPPETGE